MESQFEIVEQLRRCDIDQAADMLEFLLDQFMVGPRVNGDLSWRFLHGWPMTHCQGQTIEQAIRAAMEEKKHGSDTE